MTRCPHLGVSVRRFLAEERGTATIELVFWIPFFLLMLFVIVDASVFYWRYSAMWDATRDAARQMSVGRLGPVGPNTNIAGSVNAFVQQQLGPQYVATVHDTGTFDPAVRVSADISTLSVFNFFGAFAGGNRQIVTQVRFHKEPF